MPNIVSLGFYNEYRKNTDVRGFVYLTYLVGYLTCWIFTKFHNNLKNIYIRDNIMFLRDVNLSKLLQNINKK